MVLRHLRNITDLLIAHTATPDYCLDGCKSALRRLDVTGCECVSTIDIEVSRLAIVYPCLLKLLSSVTALRPVQLETRLCINHSDQEFGRLFWTTRLISELVGFTRLVEILFELRVV